MKNILQKQENIELFLKGYTDYNPNILKPGISLKGEDMPIKLIKGSLRYREDLKVFEARVTLNYKTKSFYDKNKIECIKKANNFYKSYYKTLTIEDSKDNITLNDWIDKWIELYKKPSVKESSLPNIMSATRKYIKPSLGKIKLKNLTALQIDSFFESIENSRHKETVCTILGDCLTMAYKKDMLKKPLHQKITKYKHTRGEGHCLTKEEEKIFLQNIEKVDNAKILYFAYLTGCRKHGALNLTWPDLDFEHKLIHIRETKTKTSDRFFPMTKKLQNFLKTLDENLSPADKKVFPISDRHYKEMINKLSQLCGFRIHTKDLRTTFSSRAREKGVAPEVLKKWLGHSSYGITEKYYVKISNDFEARQIKLLD